MKTTKILMCIFVMLVFIGLNTTKGQWLYNGTSIYNSNSGNVGIGNNSPGSLLYVAKNMTEPTITVRNLGGTGGAAYTMTDDASGANWKFKATNNGGFKIRDHANLLDVITIEPNSTANAIYINAEGNLGVRTSTPAANFHVAENNPSYTAAFGNMISGWSDGTNVSIGNDDFNSILYVGQDMSHKGYLIWNHHPEPDAATFMIGTYDGTNPMILQPAGGNVGIGTSTPYARLDVMNNLYDYSRIGNTATVANEFLNYEETATGDGQCAIMTVRHRAEQNDGAAYNIGQTNASIIGYNVWGDLFTFGSIGYNYNDFTRCGGAFGSDNEGTYWGSLGYKSSSSSLHGGYFTTTGSGSGKGSSDAHIGIGIGAWGDLFGADIHGNVYGVYAEGQHYSMFNNGAVYKNNLDVHLQANGTGTPTVLYTNTSTDVTVQTSGKATLANGAVNISFDPAFTAALASEESLVITVTPVGESQGVHLSDISTTGFKVMENNAGKSSVTVNYIAIGKRAGYENPTLTKEVIDGSYTSKLARGLHNDADIQNNGEGLYYENGQLVVGVHPSTLPDPNRPKVINNIEPAAKAGDDALLKDNGAAPFGK
ncbi:MAG TPA: hypothetical protein PLR01_05585 [Bacteroidales bacterium]|nr:hypothetical protein [Bacteroidales bacterium]